MPPNVLTVEALDQEVPQLHVAVGIRVGVELLQGAQINVNPHTPHPGFIADRFPHLSCGCLLFQEASSSV